MSIDFFENLVQIPEICYAIRPLKYWKGKQPPMIKNSERLLGQIREIHEKIRKEILVVCESQEVEQLARVSGEEGGDVIFAVDRVSEKHLLELFGQLSKERSFVLIAEGLGSTGRRVLPEGTTEEEAELQILVDPIDGTRGLMYQKRPGWILTGVAPNRAEQTRLSDIELAVQTEIPLNKQHLCDCLWAVRGQGAEGERLNRLSGERMVLHPRPSRAENLEQGFGNVVRFFPGNRAEAAAVDDELIERVMGPPGEGRAQCFEDQYICTGGQFYETLMGHDRWMADLRPVFEPVLRAKGRPLGLCAHPYDLSTALIAEEAGAVVTGAPGQPLEAPLDVETPVAWCVYANEMIQSQVEPVLKQILEGRGLLGK
jgi:hypothetical protein